MLRGGLVGQSEYFLADPGSGEEWGFAAGGVWKPGRVAARVGRSGRSEARDRRAWAAGGAGASGGVAGALKDEAPPPGSGQSQVDTDAALTGISVHVRPDRTAKKVFVGCAHPVCKRLGVGSFG